VELQSQTMSARSSLIRYTNPALKDLEGISAYGIEEWGDAKALDYLSHLYAVIETLAAHPALGVKCIGLRSGTRRLAFRQHAVYYRPIGPRILVQRVVHYRMDVRQLLWES
jgi:toxin ParE1/3/4